MTETYDFDRFIAAQDSVYDSVLEALKNGQSSSEWINCIFPRLEGLEDQPVGYYDLRDWAEAEAFLAHPILGKRLLECTKLVIHRAMMGGGLFTTEDEPFFHSSMTLFSRLKNTSPVFDSAMYAYFGEVGDPKTMKLLRRAFYVSLKD